MSDSRNGPPNIWVVSDTHLRNGQILPNPFTERVGREDIIIHLGDFVSTEIINQLQSLARLEAVSGNCDPSSVRSLVPAEKTIEINGFKIGLTHGYGGYLETIKKVGKKYGGKVDVALFGHTHNHYHAKTNGTVFFNPGSLTQGRGCSRSFALLHLDSDGPWGEVIEL